MREEVHALLREQGVTTVLVTHDQEEALSLADTVAVLRDGLIVQQAPPVELYELPADRELAGFLGAVNVLDAAVPRREGPHAPRRAHFRSGPRLSGSGVVMVRPEQIHVTPATRRRRHPRPPADAGAGAGVPLLRT